MAHDVTKIHVARDLGLDLHHFQNLHRVGVDVERDRELSSFKISKKVSRRSLPVWMVSLFRTRHKEPRSLERSRFTSSNHQPLTYRTLSRRNQLRRTSSNRFQPRTHTGKTLKFPTSIPLLASMWRCAMMLSNQRYRGKRNSAPPINLGAVTAQQVRSTKLVGVRAMWMADALDYDMNHKSSQGRHD